MKRQAETTDTGRSTVAEAFHSPCTIDSDSPCTIRLSEVTSALSSALDITEGQPEGHAVRTCMIGMKLAETLNLPSEAKSALFYALHLKDLGCSSNAARITHLFGADDRRIKRDLKTVDWPKKLASIGYVARNVIPGGSIPERVRRFFSVGLKGPAGARELFKIRCERGASIARLIGLHESTAEAIHCLDEHWNGDGYPNGIRGDAIPLLARIMSVAQTVEVFVKSAGVDEAMAMAKRRSGRWFDPEIVKVLLSLRTNRAFWHGLAAGDTLRLVQRFEPPDQAMHADDDRLDRIALGFARVIDAKSPWTFKHSEGVTSLALGIGHVLGFDETTIRELRRAALLHDIGKLGVSNAILDKPARLTDEERTAVELHPYYSHRILSKIGSFHGIAEIAAAHHERLDGNGYYRGLNAPHLSKAARALAVADKFEAISADRPYRETVAIPQVLEILEQDIGTGVCPEALRALKYHVETVGFKPSRYSEE